MSVLFIGLGGVGTHTLENLNDKMAKYHKDVYTRTGNPVTEIPKYLFIDTDNSIWEEHKNNFYPLNPNNHFIQIGLSSPDEIRVANEKVYNVSRWCDAPPKNTSMILGADATRQYSRLGLLGQYPEIHEKLTKLMSNFGDNDRIYLISGSAGGTGSGIYMDLLFLIDQIYKTNKTLQRGPNTRFIMAMPNGFIPGGDDKLNVQRYKTKLNAFATLQELNDICRDKNTQGGSCFDQSAVIIPTTQRTSFQPFRFGYLYESHNLTPKEVCQQIADFVFEIELAGFEESKHPGRGFDTDLTNKVDTFWNNSINAQEPYTKAFCAMGQFSIEKSDWLWREYFEHRLLHDLFHKGLLGEGATCNGSSIFNSLCKEISKLTTHTIDRIKGVIPASAFEQKDPPRKFWDILVDSPDMTDAEVNKILQHKMQLVENVKKSTFDACRKALMENSIEVVYKALDYLDQQYYRSAINEYELLPKAINTAKDDHNSHVYKSKNLKNYVTLMNRWLNYHVARALSSSPKNTDDISTQDHGYLDICQEFLKIAKDCELDEEKEKWESIFKKDVEKLKSKNNRYYLPDLDSIVKNGEVLKSSRLVNIYENSIVQTLSGDILQGTCTIPELHKEVLRKLEADPELRNRNANDEGYLTMMFDPNPDRVDTIRDNLTSFVSEYIRVAESTISDIIKRNQTVKNAFKTNLLQLLRQSEKKETIVTNFCQYGEVNLQTKPMATGETLQQVLYISDFHGDTALQQNLGINTALSSSIIDQPEFGDKIVKLIVNCGYSVDKYRHFDDYKNFAKAELKGNSFSHDPFIDQRFLGTPINGIYPLSVWDAIHKNVEISIRNQDFNPNLYDLSNVNLREVYGMCVVLLHEYFKQLITIDEGKGNILPKEVRKGFKHSSGLSYTITTYNYSTSRGKYMEDSTKSINIKAKNLGVNDLVNLSWWIDFIQMRREHISNHNELVSKAIDNLEAKGKGVKLSDTMNRILDNITENNYDFFESYKVWYTTKTGR